MRRDDEERKENRNSLGESRGSIELLVDPKVFTELSVEAQSQINRRRERSVRKRWGRRGEKRLGFGLEGRASTYPSVRGRHREN